MSLLVPFLTVGQRSALLRFPGLLHYRISLHSSNPLYNVSYNTISRPVGKQIRPSYFANAYNSILLFSTLALLKTILFKFKMKSCPCTSAQFKSLFWFVTYYITTVPRDNGDLANLVRETHYYISNDRSHDTLFMQYCLMLQWCWFTSNKLTPNTHCIFSDGCVDRFKGDRALYFVAR